MKIITILFLTIYLNNSYSQSTFAYEKGRHKFNLSLIFNNIINKTCKKRFDKDYEYEGRYLGKFTTKTEQFHIINSSYLHLKSLHNDNEIFIYDAKNRFIGYYNLATNYQLPAQLINNILFFKTDHCINKINLNKGIPNLICLKCNKETDCLEFENLAKNKNIKQHNGL